jgi:hypothetical protein
VSGDWLAPVATVLAGAESDVPFFFRDDDAGWDDAALWALLDEFAAAGVVIDVAAIPEAVGAGCARGLSDRLAAGTVRVHQHGRHHVNHELTGRACEFGPSRSAQDQRADIAAGRAQLEDALGRALDPVFTPPWNRCTQATGHAALAAGHTVLSRDDSAGSLGVPGLAEQPVNVDWSRRRNGVSVDARSRGLAIADRIGGSGPVGVMLHHATLDAAELRQLRRLLDLVRCSDRGRPTTIVEV